MAQDRTLTEMKNASQPEKGIFRRMWNEGGNDLIVWYDRTDGKEIGYQLCLGDTAYTYNDGRLTVNRIDSCEKDNLAPILAESLNADTTPAIDYIKDHGSLLEIGLRDYIISGLQSRS